MMTIDEIISARERIERRLNFALATMERKETIRELREQLIHIQDECPHHSPDYNWTWTDETCPYCHKKVIIKVI